MKPTVSEALKGMREPILKSWREAIISQPATSQLMPCVSTGRFADPVGHTVDEGAAGILDWLCGVAEVPLADAVDTSGAAYGTAGAANGVAAANMASVANAHLADICRIKAVQGASASQALGFIFQLKEIIHYEVEKRSDRTVATDTLYQLDRRIDQLMLSAIDMYSEQRERITQIRIDEMRRLSGHISRGCQR
ncbi:MAG: RsbRD N-terminal domain-containing protein [Actinomycetia bacterium]|nr:RsbRD N-terminal domain-containing protein [Actinomycetes bacterium]